MKPSAFVYRRPDSVEQALALLRERGDEAKIIAGGQSLVPAMNLRMATPGMLVDLGGIEPLARLSVDAGGGLVAGAMVTHNQCLHDARVAAGWPLISRVMPFVAHDQVRNRGTIGGSLSHADPAAEWPAVCLALDAQLTVASSDGEQVLPVAAFTQGVYETALQPGDILTAVRFPPYAPQWRWGFHEISRRLGDFAMAGAMVGVRLDDTGCVAEGRLVVFAAEDRAVRLDDCLAPLMGQRLDAAAYEDIGLTAAAQVSPRSDLHASAALRLNLVAVCVSKALADAGDQAMEVPHD